MAKHDIKGTGVSSVLNGRDGRSPSAIRLMQIRPFKNIGRDKRFNLISTFVCYATFKIVESFDLISSSFFRYNRDMNIGDSK